jgi:hypothetical protein
MRHDVEQIEPCRCAATHLWRRVIAQAIADAAGDGSGYDPGEREAGEADALAWLERGGLDFSLVCDLAGLDADAVREAALAIVEERLRRRLARPPRGRAVQLLERPPARAARALSSRGGVASSHGST